MYSNQKRNKKNGSTERRIELKVERTICVPLSIWPVNTNIRRRHLYFFFFLG